MHDRPAEKTRRSLFPQPLRLLAALLLAACYIVGWVDQAASFMAMFAVGLLVILIVLVNYCRTTPGQLRTRSLPLVLFLLGVATLAALIRVDDLTGNLIPTRLSFRWQPRPDELLGPPVPTNQAGADLTTSGPDDFPEFLGPGRKAFVATNLSSDWATHPPELVWKKDSFGAGWSGFVAVGGYAVTLEQRGEDELVTCYEIASGDAMWATGAKARHATVPGGVGPRSTPTIAGGRVFALGATGRLHCLEGSTGETVWQKDLLAEIGTTPAEDLLNVAWGRSASPLVDRGRVIVPLGGPQGPSLIAFDAATGNELWREGFHQVSYASPIIAHLDGVRQIVVVCQNFVCGHDAESGQQLWEFPWPGMSNSNASCSQPVVVGQDQLFLSKGYAHGATLLTVKRVNGTWQTNVHWHRRTVMKTKFTNVVIHDGHVYGLDDSRISCVELASGQRRWTRRAGYGHGQVLQVGKQLLVQAESGEVALVALTPDKFTELARFQAIEGKTWNNPCVAGDYLLVRNAGQAACYRLHRD